ncbi:MAG: TonB-dependent receptor [candidate division KSB1 bacterium]|jgi:outer membrane receptor protein involved in Fe transport|nr:TonB-dependent receptor [candidate division KSB1 bacterium]
MKKSVLKLATLLVILVLPFALLAQDGTIKGKVTDAETGEALMGANVIINGTTLGAATAMDGSYRIANVPPGTFDLKVSFMGFQSMMKSVQMTANADLVVNFELKPMVLSGSVVTTTANRAIERQTPIAFSNITGDEVANNYTTQDLPQLLQAVPGVFATTNGLGESELFVRGFDADRVQVMINGIPVNDPESQHVYWSNWTGLSSNVQSVQVQRGVGSSLYGSGAFGGSLNIETMGLTPAGGITIRSSVGLYTTEGATGGGNSGKIADGNGGFEDYTPVNYNLSVRYNSGLLNDGKFNFSLMAERKAGDSYVNGTNYDGWSFGFEGQSILGAHKLLYSLISAPQKHNQAYTNQDLNLIPKLGREYNRVNHPYQENYYNKPFLSLRHEWTISRTQNMMTNVFATMGRGGGKYLRNDNFDVNTGEVTFKSVSESTDNKYMGRHARFIYENTGVVLNGYSPAAQTFEGQSVSSAANLISGSYNHSWQNDSQNDHDQIGLNTYYQHTLMRNLDIVVGGETRRWVADHYAQSFNFRSNDDRLGDSGNVIVFDEVQRRYDYTTTVVHYSGFGRLQVRPIENMNVMFDAQVAHYSYNIDENPIEIFDFRLGQFTGHKYRSTADRRDDNGNPLFKDSEYERTFTFFTPKFGVNYNLTESFNVMANFSIANKEPDAGDWYDRDNGPGVNQPEGEDLKAEKVSNVELGVGYRSMNLAINANLYRIQFTDKIERVTPLQGERMTVNAGKAVHQGVELAANSKFGKIDASAALTYAQNRWDKMNLEQIFSVDADDIVDKVVPFSPEIMANVAVGYRFGDLRLGLGVNYWDEYYGSYSNTYTDVNGNEVSAKLPKFIDVSANVSYSFDLIGAKAKVRLDLGNLLNRKDNYASAAYSADYNRNDDLAGSYYMYVMPAPLFNTFLTTEIMF